MKTIGKVFLVCALAVFLFSATQSGYGQDNLLQRAFNDDDPGVREALKLLSDKGYLQAPVEEIHDPFLRDSNCIFILKEEALQGSFMEAITNNTLNNIKQINVKFVQGAIHLTGKIKTLITTSNFSVIVKPESDDDNVVDFVLSKMQVSGINLKIFSGTIFNLIKNRLKKVFKDSVDFTDLGTDSAGNCTLRARIWPEFFSPTFGIPGNLNAVRISGNEFQILITLK